MRTGCGAIATLGAVVELEPGASPLALECVRFYLGQDTRSSLDYGRDNKGSYSRLRLCEPQSIVGIGELLIEEPS
jgi:hypothetical protein